MEITDKLNNCVQVLAFAKLVRQGCKLFQQDFTFFGRNTGPCLPGVPELAPLIINPGLTVAPLAPLYCKSGPDRSVTSPFAVKLFYYRLVIIA